MDVKKKSRIKLLVIGIAVGILLGGLVGFIAGNLWSAHGSYYSSNRCADWLRHHLVCEERAG